MSLSLADLFRAEARAGTRSSHKAVINIFLGGGPPHQDMWEIKTEAPAEIRGEFKPIATKVPGIEICEVFPQLAGLDGQGRGHSLGRRRDGPARGLSVQHRLAARQSAVDRRPAEPGRDRRPSCKGRLIPAIPPFVGPGSPHPARARGPTRARRVSSGRRMPRSSPTGRRWRT